MQKHTLKAVRAQIKKWPLNGWSLKYLKHQLSKLSVLEVKFHTFQWYLIYPTQVTLEDKSKPNEQHTKLSSSLI